MRANYKDTVIMTDKQEPKAAQTEPEKSKPTAADTKVVTDTSKADKASKTTPASKPAAAKAKPAQAATSKPAAPNSPKANTAAPTTVKKGGGLATVLALVALLLGAYAAYQAWLNNQQVQTYTQQQQQDQLSLLQAQDQKIAAVSAAADTMQANISREQAAVLAQQARMDEALQKALQQMAQKQNEEQVQLPKWELAEAEYLLRLANQRLAMEQNPASALTLLQAADEIMRTSEQLGSYGVRQAIAKDIAALTAVPVVDMEGVFARMSALMDQSSDLTYLAPTAAKVSAPIDTSASVVAVAEQDAGVEPMALTWTQKALVGSQQVLSNTWQELKVLVRVQERSNADQLLLTPEVEALLRMRMQLALSQAQVALLRGQQSVYQASLGQVALMLQDYYRTTDTVAQAMAAQITELSQLQVMAKMPDISSSLYALQDLQAAIHAQQGAN